MFKDGGLIAPNGKKSNLTEQQYKLVRTPAFKKWFGDWEKSPKISSKLVDENGEPLVVFHSGNEGITIFDKERVGITKSSGKRVDVGFYFGDKETAKLFDRYKSETYEVFLNIRNPYFVDVKQEVREYTNDYKDNPEEAKHITDIWEGKTGETLNSAVDFYDFDTSIANNYAIENGNDGFIIIGVDGSFIYNVFEPNQIKLSDGTNTTFDKNNPDIRFGVGGQLKKESELMYRDMQTRKFVRNIHPDKLNVMRVGGEYSHESRGGDWYEFDGGQESSFSREKQGGVGGGKMHRKTISLKNPYYFDTTDALSESSQTPKLYEKITSKHFPAIMGTVWAEGKAEKYYSDAEKEIATKLGKQGYDGVIFIQDGMDSDVGKTYIGDIFHFKPELVKSKFNNGGETGNTV